MEKKGSTVIEYFYAVFEKINKYAYDQLPSKQGGYVVGGPSEAPYLPSEPEASEMYVVKVKDDFVYLSNKGTINDVALQLLVETLTNQKVFNPAEKDKHLNRNEELHRRVTDFLMDVMSKGRRSCYLFYKALAEHCADVCQSLPSSGKVAEQINIR
ncbi:uncharacterized protein [Heterodontus francisci]